jgi:vacuolar-type H+-ATPase subunit C/Vma6
VTIYLGDLNTRATGLSTRLLTPDVLARFARARSLFALQREMRAVGLIGSDVPAMPAHLERAARRQAAELMGILGRWTTDERRPVLAVLLEDEERRSIQTILRGAQQGAPAEARISGLVPTIDLTERALQVLAEQPTMTDVVRMLVLWGHPLGRALVEVTAAAHPSLFATEVELQRAFARRAGLHAHKGGRELVEYVEQVVDLMNIWTVLLHFPERSPELAELAFIDGGRRVDRALFEALLETDTVEEVRQRLAKALRGSTLGSVFGGEIEPISSLERRVLQAQIVEQRRAARTRPESAAPLIAFSLSLRAQALNLRRIIWGVALQAPAALVQPEMVG